LLILGRNGLFMIDFSLPLGLKAVPPDGLYE